MLVFTPDVKEVLRWFHATHAQDAGLAGGQWRRIALPEAGAVSDQDARLMEQLEHLRLVMSVLATEGVPRGDDGGELAAFRREHGRNQV